LKLAVLSEIDLKAFRHPVKRPAVDAEDLP
jgi:hypothetical protein